VKRPLLRTVFKEVAGTIFLVCLGSTCVGQSYIIQTVAGAGISYGPYPAPANSVSINDPTGVAVDSAGNVYYGGGIDNVVYKLSGGTVSVVAGALPVNGVDNSGYSGDGGPATKAKLNDPQGVAVDSAGNLYIVDYLNYAIREVSAATGNIATIAGNGSYGAPVPGPATASPMYQPVGIAVDAGGNVYVGVGIAGGFILKIANGTLAIVAGVGYEGPVTSGALATTQPIVGPQFISVDSSGNVYIPTSGYVFELVVASGVLNIIAGTGDSGYSGDGGPASNAMVFSSGVAVDASGNIFIADTGNSAVREVTNGTITTIAGMPPQTGGFCSATAAAATSVTLNNPGAIAVGNGKIYLEEAGCIQQLTGAPAGPPSIKSGGVVSAGAYGDFSSVAPGSWIEIYGANLAVDSRQWAASDFKGSAAPISLDGTSVTIGGQSAFVDYISSAQVNAQIPLGIGSGPQQLVVTTPSGAMATSTITVSPSAAGLLAPSQFVVAGKQYAGALFTDGVTYVLPTGAVSGATSRPAHVGDTVVIYGVGFGAVTPSTPAGQIASGQTQLASSLQIFFGGSQATLSYQGLAPGFVGLYQFDVVVPNVAASSLVPLTFTLGGAPGAQTLYTAVQ
jgi:uncharacterized protein (TIGR03437 family)